MLAYADREALRRTLATGRAWYYSRSRKSLWLKGETSGNWQRVLEVRRDCDGDAVLYLVEQQGVACHTGAWSCFTSAFGTAPLGVRVVEELFGVIRKRLEELPENSYTAYLARSGLPAIAKKVGEEGVEVALAGVQEDDEALVGEAADLFYHLLVLLAARGLKPADLWEKLAARRR